MRDVVAGFAMLQYGNVMRWGRTVPGAEGGVLPQGEGYPPLDHWLELIVVAPTIEDVRTLVELAREELTTWRRRVEPPPEGETFGDLKRRILHEGEGWTPQEVALAMRVTPTLVRNVRIEAERGVEYGRPDGSLKRGLALLADGFSYRQVEQITGVPKSTLFDAARAA